MSVRNEKTPSALERRNALVAAQISRVFERARAEKRMSVDSELVREVVDSNFAFYHGTYTRRFYNEVPSVAKMEPLDVLTVAAFELSLQTIEMRANGKLAALLIDEAMAAVRSVPQAPEFAQAA